MVLSIILGRKGSKRCPGKNKRSMCGIPLVGWQSIQATCSKLIDKVYIYSDDEEAVSIAEKYGVKSVAREPVKDEESGGTAVIQCVKKLSDDGLVKQGDIVVTLFPTSPLRFPDDIDNMIMLHKQTNKPVAGYAKRKETCISRIIDEKKQYPIMFDKYWGYCEGAGGMSCISASYYFEQFDKPQVTDFVMDREPEKYHITDKIGIAYYMRPWQANEVDTEEDFLICEKLLPMIIGDKMEKVYYNYKEGKEWQI